MVMSLNYKNATWLTAVTLALSLLFSMLAANPLAAFAQTSSANSAPTIAWERQLMGGEGYSIYQLPNGGFVFDASNGTATFLVKTSSDGNVEYSKAITVGQQPTVLPYFVQTLDGGYAFAGNLSNFYTLLKTDSEGNVTWTKSYPSSLQITYMRAMIQTRDGGFALAGFGQVSAESVGWSWFARTDALGNLLWNRTLSETNFDCPSAIIEETNGDFTLSDVIFSLEPNYALFNLIRTDHNGKVLWNQTYGEMGGNDTYRTPECNTVISTDDGGYLIAGWLAGRNAWVVKTDAAGKMLWNQTYGQDHSAVVSAKQLNDGDYVFAAVQNISEAWLLKTDSLGNKIWNITLPGGVFPGALEANYNNIIQTVNGSYVVLGTKNNQVWLANLANQETTTTSNQFLIVAVIVVAAVIVTLCIIAGHSLLKWFNNHNKALTTMKK